MRTEQEQIGHAKVHCIHVHAFGLQNSDSTASLQSLSGFRAFDRLPPASLLEAATDFSCC
jgi:hypothetical protein